MKKAAFRFGVWVVEMVSPSQQDSADFKRALDSISFQLKAVVGLLSVIRLLMLFWFGVWLSRT